MGICTEILSEQFNVIRLDDDGITPMEKFVGTTTYIYSLKFPHVGLSSLGLGCKIARQYIWTIQVENPLTFRDLPWSLTIQCRIISSGSKPSNWSCLTSISCGFWWWIYHSSIHEVRHNIHKLDRSCATHITKLCTREYLPQGYLVHSRSLIMYQQNPKLISEHWSIEWNVIAVRTTWTINSD